MSKRDEENELKRWFMKQFYEMAEAWGFKIDYDEFMPGSVSVRFPKGGKPTDTQLEKVLETAQRMEWENLYVFKKDGKTPDYETINRLNTLILQKGLTGLKVCNDPVAYDYYGSIKAINAENKVNHPFLPFVKCSI